MKPRPLTDAELDEIERLARTDAAEAYRGPLRERRRNPWPSPQRLTRSWPEEPCGL